VAIPRARVPPSTHADPPTHSNSNAPRGASRVLLQRYSFSNDIARRLGGGSSLNERRAECLLASTMKHLHPRCPVIVTVFAIQNELQCMGMAMDMIMCDMLC